MPSHETKKRQRIVVMDAKAFLLIEKKYRLNEFELNGIQVWNIIRTDLWNYDICSKSLGLGNSHYSERMSFLSMLALIKSVFNGFLYKLEKSDYLVICHERRIYNRNYYDDPYTELIFQQLKGKTTAVEKPFHYHHLSPTREKIFPLDWIIIKGNCYSLLKKHLKTPEYRNIRSTIRNAFKAPLEEIKIQYSWERNLEDIFSECATRYFIYKKLLKGYQNIMNKVLPSALIETVYYSFYNMPFNEIARKMKIPVVELQHGTIYDNHIAYSYHSEAQPWQLPTKMLLFSDYWKKFIHVPIEYDSVVAVGYPWLEREINKAILAIPRKKGRILFVSQGTIGKELSMLAREFCLSTKNNDYEIIFKLHPADTNDWERRYPELLHPGITVYSDNNSSLYGLMASSEFQVGVYSTAIYEGLGFGLKTFILQVGHYLNMQPLVDAGYASYIKNSKDLLLQLKQSSNICNIERNAPDTFWKKNSLKNIMKEIDNSIV